MNILLFATLIAVLVEGRTGSAWDGFKAGVLVLGMCMIWIYLMAERDDRILEKAKEAEDPEHPE